MNVKFGLAGWLSLSTLNTPNSSLRTKLRTTLTRIMVLAFTPHQL